MKIFNENIELVYTNIWYSNTKGNIFKMLALCALHKKKSLCKYKYSPRETFTVKIIQIIIKFLFDHSKFGWIGHTWSKWLDRNYQMRNERWSQTLNDPNAFCIFLPSVLSVREECTKKCDEHVWNSLKFQAAGRVTSRTTTATTRACSTGPDRSARWYHLANGSVSRAATSG